MLRLLPVLLLILAANLEAQYVAVGQQAVIATSGLNLRAAARTDGHVLATIPFGDQVNVFDRCAYSVDTLGQLQDYYRMHDHLGDSLVYGDHPITGTWYRVAYGNDTGFVFNAYLSVPFDPQAPALDYSSDGQRPLDYVLIYPGGDCGGRVYSPTVYSFYGVYDEGNGQNNLRKIDVSFLQITDDFEVTLITTDEHRGLRFIIGSKQPLQPHTFTGRYFDQPAVGHADPEAAHHHDREHPELPPAITIDTTHQYGEPLIRKVSLSHRQTTQILLDDGYDYECRLDGTGDIDGDGRPDYLISMVGGQESQTRLYLSTARKKGELVGRVATAWFSCCC